MTNRAEGPGRRRLPAILLVHALILLAAPALHAGQTEAVAPAEVVQRANYLKGLLDNLLLSPNVSSIKQAITENGNADVETLIDEALALRAEGERALAEKNHLESVVKFQSSIEHVFEAIRTAEHTPAEEQQKTAARLARHFKTNQTFITAATRVVQGEHDEDAARLLQLAKEGRARAEAKAKGGSEDEALAELDESTSLAKRAIIAVRSGKVIERKATTPAQPAPRDAGTAGPAGTAPADTARP